MNYCIHVSVESASLIQIDKIRLKSLPCPLRGEELYWPEGQFEQQNHHNDF